MAPLYPLAVVQGSHLDDPTISAVRPFGLLFPNAPITLKNETALMRIVSNFRDLKLGEPDATQRALMVQYISFYIERAVVEEGICAKPAPAHNSNILGSGSGLRAASQRDFKDDESNQQVDAQDSMKRKRRLQQFESDRDGGEECSKRRKTDIKEAEVDDLVYHLEPVQYTLSSEITVANVEAARRDFLAGVKSLTFGTGKKNQKTSCTISPTQAIEITDYFFTVMLGSDIQVRISVLVEYCNSVVVEDVMCAGGSLAGDLARDENIPLPLRNFYHQFAQAHQQYLKAETPYSTLMRRKEYLALHNEWQNLLSEGSKYRKELINFLKLSSSLKKRFNDSLKKHICSSLKITSTKQFLKSMEAQSGIRTLVNHFGYGILVVLPPDADRKFSEWNHTKTMPVLKLFKKSMTCIRPLCKMIASKIYEPIIAGRLLPQFAKDTRWLSLEQMLESLDNAAAKRQEMEEHICVQAGNNRIAEERTPMREPNSLDR